MQHFYKVYVNGRLTKITCDKEEAFEYARKFENVVDEGDFIYVICETKEIIYELRKGVNHVVG